MVDFRQRFTLFVPTAFEIIITASIKGNEDVFELYVMPTVPNRNFLFVIQAQAIRIVCYGLIINELAFVFCSTFL